MSRENLFGKKKKHKSKISRSSQLGRNTYQCMSRYCLVKRKIPGHQEPQAMCRFDQPMQLRQDAGIRLDNKRRCKSKLRRNDSLMNSFNTPMILGWQWILTSSWFWADLLRLITSPNTLQNQRSRHHFPSLRVKRCSTNARRAHILSSRNSAPSIRNSSCPSFSYLPSNLHWHRWRILGTGSTMKCRIRGYGWGWRFRYRWSMASTIHETPLKWSPCHCRMFYQHIEKIKKV